MYFRVDITVLRLFLLVLGVNSIRFERNVVAVGLPYYMIVMTLGECHDFILFHENKVWGAVNLNQVMDIYYSSHNKDQKVSKVLIKLVINNTNVFAVSEGGVGSNVFSGTVFVPIRVGVMLYQLTIYTCNRPHIEKNYNFESSAETDAPKKILNDFYNGEIDEKDGFEPLKLATNKTVITSNDNTTF